jgi:hypothetical protein
VIEAVTKEPMLRANNAREGATSAPQTEAISAATAATRLHHAAQSASVLTSKTTNAVSAAHASSGAATAIASRTGYADFWIQSVYP